MARPVPENLRATLLGEGHLLLHHPDDLDDRIDHIVVSWGSGSMEFTRPFPNALRIKTLKPGDPVSVEYR